MEGGIPGTPELALRPMRDVEFAAYLAYFVPDYAAEMATNYGLSAAQALTRASAEVADDLRGGPRTEGEVLLCLVDERDTLLGYLWYRPDIAQRSAFISDFHILPAHQGKGFGKTALGLIEARLAAEGLTEIRLRVAADNVRARHVYETSGFRTTGFNMSKRIGEV
ncbi:GNAT family N-acetyltransferase [Pararhizobium antarcticum]|uniref:Acetyltransferase n=1 Tax=Pararhizobium antarcticum TaxID=1798805 RepID=A0A657LMP6_9HYPH|nr:GNAT family N-acetyltransferase [Pararhizobium antarcticum]OJF92426.1 acetyltransferase [Pararhizobium antarcticum]OJF99117.1 acetyltransferase [Rhizobium sp. 58]